LVGTSEPVGGLSERRRPAWSRVVSGSNGWNFAARTSRYARPIGVPLRYAPEVCRSTGDVHRQVAHLDAGERDLALGGDSGLSAVVSRT